MLPRFSNDFVMEIVSKVKKAEEARDSKEACILKVPMAIVGESTKFYHPTMLHKRKLQAIVEEIPEISDERYLPYGADKLKKAGVVFQAMENSGIPDIHFDKQTGKLFLPQIDVGVWTEAIFRNLLAYEACYKTGSSELLETSSDEDQKLVTRFVLFMSQLVETEKDADVLREEKIIQNNLGDSKEVARMWNDMNSSRWIPKCNQFDEITRELNGYIGQQWVVWFAELWERYCSKPWLVFAVIVAVIVFAETLVSLWTTLKSDN
ncbi:hypothetical protein SUGI_0705050 [Cryptomeria japonica]|nr:hypothetical protein SUGI_0705050 [Cryptomeria japonica]